MTFEPTVTAAPSDWTLPLSYAVATPSISPVTGTYTATQDRDHQRRDTKEAPSTTQLT